MMVSNANLSDGPVFRLEVPEPPLPDYQAGPDAFSLNTGMQDVVFQPPVDDTLVFSDGIQPVAPGNPTLQDNARPAVATQLQPQTTNMGLILVAAVAVYFLFLK